LFAAFIYVASELTFILNSGRLLPGGNVERAEQVSNLRGPLPGIAL
jgi:hypothetical protein